jgi:formiminotetrahydrofolate cyclodeaminase
MNNITTYTAKHNKEAFEYSPYDQSLNYYKINKETKFARSRNNNNYCSYVSKSYDNVRKSISKKEKNIYMNISTINNKIESYQYDNSKSDFSYNYCNMFSLNCNYI